MPNLDPSPSLPPTKVTGNTLSAAEVNQLSESIADTRTALGTIDDGATQTLDARLEAVESVGGVEVTASRDLAASDAGKLLENRTAGDKTLTVRTQANVPITAGRFIHAGSFEGGNLDFALETGVTMPGRATVNPGDLATIARITGDRWMFNVIRNAGAGGSTESPLTTGFTRESLLANRVGFGELAGGEGDGEPTDALTFTEFQFTNLNNSGAGSLRQCLLDAASNGNGWITAAPGLTGTLTPTQTMRITSNIVLDVRGADVTLEGDTVTVFDTGFTLPAGPTNIMIRYLKFLMADGASASTDLLQMSGVRDVYIANNTFTGQGPADESSGDGWLDIAHLSDGTESTDVTVEHNLFDSCNKTCGWSTTQNVAGDGTTKTDKGKFTAVRNLWRNNRQRQPMIKNGLLDFVNNWIDGWGVDSPSGLAVTLQNSAEGHIRSNVVDATHRTAVVTELTSGVTGIYAEDGGGNLLTGGATITEVDPTDVFDPATYYSITPATADQALRDYLTANAGWKSVSP